MKNPFWRLVTRREGFIFYKHAIVVTHKSGERVTISVESRDPELVAHIAAGIREKYDPTTLAKTKESTRDDSYTRLWKSLFGSDYDSL